MSDRPDHDTHWKLLIVELFEDFVKFFLPHIYPLIDWTKPVEPQEQELHKIVADKFKGDTVVNDKLFKVYLKAGGDQLLLIHIEVQSSYKANFMERMFVYFYRIFDSRGKIVTALALLTNDSLPKNYDRYEYDLLGTTLTYKFNTYCVKHAKEEDLLASSNPFALAVLAAKYVNKSKNKGRLRYQYKLKLFRLALELGKYSHESIRGLIRFIQLLMVLPNELEKELAIELEETYELKKKIMDAATKERTEIFMNTMHQAVYGETVDEMKIRERQEFEKQIVEQLEKQIAEQLEKQLAEQLARKEQESAEQLEKQLAEQLARKEQESAEQLARKEQESAEQLAQKEQESAEQLARKERESAEQLVREKQEAVINMLTMTDLSAEKIAKIIGFTKQEVLDIKVKMEKK